MKYPTIKIISIGIMAVALILVSILGIVKVNLDQNAEAICTSVHPDQVGICPAHMNNSSWLIIVAFGVSIIVLGFGVFLYLMPPQRQEKKQVDISKLDEDEKRIYQLLLEHEGSMYQSDLIKEIGCSKVKMSRLVDKMSIKDILEKKRRGMTNLVVVK